jgi:opacity protein-like surface antigen
MAISRTVEPSLAGGLTVTYFPQRALGVQFDVAYLGLPLSTHCTLVNGGSAQNQQVCASTVSSPSASAIAFELGAIVRHPSGASGLSPYVRAGFGLVTRGSSTVEVVGSFAQGATLYTRPVITDDSPKHTSASLTVGAGLIVSLSPGYAFRLEARDVYASLARVEGPADVNSGVALTGTRFYHHLLLSMGLGIVLEQKRGRRY